MIKDAEERIAKWIADSGKAQIEWKIETGEHGRTKIKMCQVFNNGFSVKLASVVYDMDGADFDGYISEEEAIARAKNFILEKYGESDWQRIITYEVKGEYSDLWIVQYMRRRYAGYEIHVDTVTGETTFFSMMK